MPREPTLEEIAKAQEEQGNQAMRLAAEQIGGTIPDDDAHWVERERYAARRALIAQQIMGRLN
jgi:hypothetical protein